MTNLIAMVVSIVITNVSTNYDIPIGFHTVPCDVIGCAVYHTANDYAKDQYRVVNTVTSQEVIRVTCGDTVVSETVKTAVVLKQTERRHVKKEVIVDEPERDITGMTRWIFKGKEEWFAPYSYTNTVTTNVINTTTGWVHTVTNMAYRY